jgi:CheY-like chemotaxis protein
MGMPRVVIIDDNIDHLEIAKFALASQYDVVIATDGLEGYAEASRPDVAVIVLDLSMPIVDGWTVLQKLRTNPSTRLVPVLIVTALHDATIRTRARALGVETILHKPVDWTRVSREIARLIPPG